MFYDFVTIFFIGGDIKQERAEEVGGVKPSREGQDDWQGSGWLVNFA